MNPPNKNDQVQYCNKISDIKPVFYAKGDSAATAHYFMESDAEVLQDIKEEKGPPVGLPNATQISSTRCGTLPISGLSLTAKRARILPELKSSSLLSLSQLTDGGCM